MSPRQFARAVRRFLGLDSRPPVRTSEAHRTLTRFRPTLEACEDRTNPTPVVTVAALADASESSMLGVSARLTRTETSGSLVVNFSLSGTAGADVDYYSSTVATFLNGNATTDVAFMPVNDSTSEATETIVLTLTSGTGYTIGNPASATLNLLDNDTQVVTVEQIQGAAERGSSGVFRFTRLGDLSSSLTANFSVGGTATSGTDYTSIGTTIAFAAGAATADKTVATIDDNIYDAFETVEVTVTSGTGYTVGTEDEAGLYILDSVALTFTLNGYLGAVKYTSPLGDIDPDDDSQSLTPTAFNLNIGGQNFAYGTANYTTAPTLLYEYGALVGVEFEVDLTGTGSPFVNIALTGGVATGLDSQQEEYNDNAEKKNASITIDFDAITIPTPAMMDIETSIRCTAVDNTERSARVILRAGMTKTQVRDAYVAALLKAGFNAGAVGDSNKLVIWWYMRFPDNSQLKKVEAFNFGQTGDCPKFVEREAGPDGTLPTYVENP